LRLKRLSENVAAGIPACRRGWHLAVRKKRPQGETLGFHRGFSGSDAFPSGWPPSRRIGALARRESGKPRLSVSQGGRRCVLQSGSWAFALKALKKLAFSRLTWKSNFDILQSNLKKTGIK
jgi:hypothetical protein